MLNVGLTLLGMAVACAPAWAQEPGILPPKVGGYIQLRETAQKDVGLTALLNRARVSVDGGLPARFSYRALIEFEAATGAKTPAAVSLREAIIRWSLAPFAVTAGQFKTPFSREYLIPVPQLETADFAAVVDSLSPKYDVGVMGEAVWPVATFYFGAFNGEGQNATANRDSVVMLVARAVVRPIAQLALGANAARDGPDSLRWGIEENLEERGLLVRSEYLARHRRGRPSADDDFGWYVFGGFRAVPFVQIIGQVEDFQRPSFGVSRRVRGTTIGTNLDLSPNHVKLLVEGMRRLSGAKQTRVDSVLAQLQVRF